MCSKHFFAARCAALLLILTALAVIGTCMPVVTCVSVSNRKEMHDRVLSKKALGGFCISYTHSVNKGRVHDYYTVTPNGMLVLERTVFVSYGAGIPEPEETPGALFTVKGDGYEISNINRSLQKLVMAVGVIAEHSIAVYQDEETGYGAEIPLKTLFAPQTSLIFETKHVPLLAYLLSRHI